MRARAREVKYFAGPKCCTLGSDTFHHLSNRISSKNNGCWRRSRPACCSRRPHAATPADPGLDPDSTPLCCRLRRSACRLPLAIAMAHLWRSRPDLCSAHWRRVWPSRSTLDPSLDTCRADQLLLLCRSHLMAFVLALSCRLLPCHLPGLSVSIPIRLGLYEDEITVGTSRLPTHQ